MAKAKGPPGQQGDTNEALVLVAIFLIALLLWWAFKARIAAIVLSVRLFESYFISFFTGELDDLRSWMRGINRRSVTGLDLFVVSQKVGWYVRFLTAPVLIYLGYRLSKLSPLDRFKRKFTHETLPPAQADLFPWMKISTEIDFLKMDPEVGPWALSKTERIFAREYKLRDANGVLSHERTERVFIKQLGNIWLGYKRMKPHYRALFAMLAARVNRDFRASDELIRQLARSAATGTIDLTGVDEMAAKYIDSKPVKRAIREHAYERTILMTLLERVRGNGKDPLPPNWFLWLKGVDRGLWYALSNVGRVAPQVEAGGVFCHWLAEKARRKRLEMPWVKNAVLGLEGELKKFTEDGDRDLSDDEEEITVKRPPVPKFGAVVQAPKEPGGPSYPPGAEQVHRSGMAGRSDQEGAGRDRPARGQRGSVRSDDGTDF